MTTTHTVQVAIPGRPQMLWPLLRNVMAWPAWLPTVAGVEQLRGERLEPGARFRVVHAGLGTTVWTVERVAPFVGFSWAACLPCLRVRRDYDIVPIDAGTLNLTIRATTDGKLADLAERSMADLQREADSFRRLLERLGARAEH